MGKATKFLSAFIDDIPSAKLTAFPHQTKTVYEDNDFRLDMQGITTDKLSHNVQIQVNKQTKKTSLKGLAPQTVATIKVPVDDSMTAEEVRKALHEASAL